MCLKKETEKCWLCLLQFDWSYLCYVLLSWHFEGGKKQLKTVLVFFTASFETWRHPMLLISYHWNATLMCVRPKRCVFVGKLYLFIVSKTETKLCFFSCFMFTFLTGDWPDTVFMTLKVIFRWDKAVFCQNLQADLSVAHRPKAICSCWRHKF